MSSTKCGFSLCCMCMMIFSIDSISSSRPFVAFDKWRIVLGSKFIQKLLVKINGNKITCSNRRTQMNRETKYMWMLNHIRVDSHNQFLFVYWKWPYNHLNHQNRHAYTYSLCHYEHDLLNKTISLSWCN